MRRIAAILSVSMVTVLASGSIAGASTVDLSQYTAVGTGKVLQLNLQLPAAVTGAVNTVLGTVSGAAGTSIQLPATIDETIGYSQSIGKMVNQKVNGSSVGRMFYGTLDKPVLEPAVGLLFPERAGKGLPIAQAVLGQVQHSVDSLANLQLPNATAPIVNLGLMNVKADSTPVANVAAALSGASSSLANLRVDLAPQIKELLLQLAAPLVDKVDNEVLPQLNTLLGQLTDTLKDTLDLDVNLQLPKIADLLDRPLLSIGKIITTSSTDAIGRLRNATASSIISDINIFGTSAQNALVHIDVLKSEVLAAIDGTAAGAKAVATQKIVGLSVLDNELAIFNDKIKVLNKEIPVSLESVTDVLNQVTGLVGQTLGLNITALKTDTSKSAMHSYASSQTLKISFHPVIAGLGALDQLGLDIEAPSAVAEVAADSVKGVCIGRGCNPLPTTGVPTTAYFLAGPALLGLAVLVRKYTLAH